MALKDAANDVDNAIALEGYKGMSFENAFGGALIFHAASLFKRSGGRGSCGHRRAV
jgi:hypothetical protein